MRIDEIDKRIDSVMKTDATFAREADFMFTHVPFKKLYDYIPDSGSMQYDGGAAHYYINPEDYRDSNSFNEEELLKRFLSNPESHMFYLVQGNSGTGKSNLIRWTYYKYKKALEEEHDEYEQIIFIQRSYNSLKEAVKRILDYNILNPDRTQYYLDKIGGGGYAASGEELAETLYANLQIVVKFNKDYDRFLSEDLYVALKAVLEDANVKKYIFLREDGPITKLRARITGDKSNGAYNGNAIFEDKDFTFSVKDLMRILMSDGHKPTQEVHRSINEIVSNNENRKSVIKFLNSITEIVIGRSSTLDATDVKSIFMEIRKELKAEGKRLTLFIEDINAYTGMDGALIEMLIGEESDDHDESNNEMCRMKSMVGSTDSFYDMLGDSLKMRITNSIVVLDTSILEDDEKLLEFAAKYINAVNVSAAEVDQWYAGGSMPIAEIKNDATSINIDGNQYTIFPFTKYAIINLFNCLQPNSRTPRGLLKFVLKHNLSQWNALEDKIFESQKYFTNIALKSLTSTRLPQAVSDALSTESEKRKLFVRLWGYDFINNKVIDFTESELNVFGFSEHNQKKIDVKVPPKSEKMPILQKEVQVRDKNAEKKERALNHLDEWAGGINPNFVQHKDVRQWIGNFILGNINWELEDILYSRAKDACNKLSFIKIEGQESSTEYGIEISRTPENADFIRAIIYWNYDGNRKSWKFESGLEQKIIAKAWLIKNKETIIDAIKRFSNLDQYSIEYITRAKFDIAVASGLISNLDVNDVSKVLIKEEVSADFNYNEKSENWQELFTATRKNKDEISMLFRETYYRTVGSSSVDNKNYAFVDIASLHIILNEVILDFKNGNDKKIPLFGEKSLEIPIETINIYNNKKQGAVDYGDKVIRKAYSFFEEKFGEDVNKKSISECVMKANSYLNYVNSELNQAVPTELLQSLKTKEAHEQLCSLYLKCRDYIKAEDEGTKIVILSSISEVNLEKYMNEIVSFEKFMKNVEDKYATNINTSTEKDISRRKDDIAKLVEDIVKEG